MSRFQVPDWGIMFWQARLTIYEPGGAFDPAEYRVEVLNWRRNVVFATRVHGTFGDDVADAQRAAQRALVRAGLRLPALCRWEDAGGHRAVAQFKLGGVRAGARYGPPEEELLTAGL